MNSFGLKMLPDGEGGFGRCYILNNDTLYKEFFKQINGEYPFKEDNFEKTVGLKVPGFVFPNELDVEDGYVRGYTMDFIHAPRLEDTNFEFSINDFIMALDKLKNGLYKLTDEGILICDVNAKNMLYDGETIHVIDTDLYGMASEMDVNPEDANEDYLSSYLYYFFTQEKYLCNIEKLIDQNEYLRWLNQTMIKKGSINNLKEFLFELRDSVSKLAHREIDDFDDMYSEIERIR